MTPSPSKVAFSKALQKCNTKDRVDLRLLEQAVRSRGATYCRDRLANEDNTASSLGCGKFAAVRLSASVLIARRFGLSHCSPPSLPSPSPCASWAEKACELSRAAAAARLLMHEACSVESRLECNRSAGKIARPDRSAIGSTQRESQK